MPEGYDTFLFLDCDVHILGDIGLGFEKAERHGLAIVPAPNYNLGEFFGFKHLMAEAGVSAAGQTMYNSGVIFFQRVRYGSRRAGAMARSQRVAGRAVPLTVATSPF